MMSSCETNSVSSEDSGMPQGAALIDLVTSPGICYPCGQVFLPPDDDDSVVSSEEEDEDNDQFLPESGADLARLCERRCVGKSSLLPTPRFKPLVQWLPEGHGMLNKCQFPKRRKRGLYKHSIHFPDKYSTMSTSGRQLFQKSEVRVRERLLSGHSSRRQTNGLWCVNQNHNMTRSQRRRSSNPSLDTKTRKTNRKQSSKTLKEPSVGGKRFPSIGSRSKSRDTGKDHMNNTDGTMRDHNINDSFHLRRRETSHKSFDVQTVDREKVWRGNSVDKGQSRVSRTKNVCSRYLRNLSSNHTRSDHSSATNHSGVAIVQSKATAFKPKVVRTEQPKAQSSNNVQIRQPNCVRVGQLKVSSPNDVPRARGQPKVSTLNGVSIGQSKVSSPNHSEWPIRQSKVSMPNATPVKQYKDSRTKSAPVSRNDMLRLKGPTLRREISLRQMEASSNKRDSKIGQAKILGPTADVRSGGPSKLSSSKNNLLLGPSKASFSQTDIPKGPSHVVNFKKGVDRPLSKVLTSKDDVRKSQSNVSSSKSEVSARSSGSSKISALKNEIRIARPKGFEVPSKSSKPKASILKHDVSLEQPTASFTKSSYPLRQAKPSILKTDSRTTQLKPSSLTKESSDVSTGQTLISILKSVVATRPKVVSNSISDVPTGPKESILKSDIPGPKTSILKSTVSGPKLTILKNDVPGPKASILKSDGSRPKSSILKRDRSRGLDKTSLLKTDDPTTHFEGSESSTVVRPTQPKVTRFANNVCVAQAKIARSEGDVPTGQSRITSLKKDAFIGLSAGAKRHTIKWQENKHDFALDQPTPPGFKRDTMKGQGDKKDFSPGQSKSISSIKDSMKGQGDTPAGLMRPCTPAWKNVTSKCDLHTITPAGERKPRRRVTFEDKKMEEDKSETTTNSSRSPCVVRTISSDSCGQSYAMDSTRTDDGPEKERRAKRRERVVREFQRLQKNLEEQHRIREEEHRRQNEEMKARVREEGRKRVEIFEREKRMKAEDKERMKKYEKRIGNAKEYDAQRNIQRRAEENRARDRQLALQEEERKERARKEKENEIMKAILEADEEIEKAKREADEEIAEVRRASEQAIRRAQRSRIEKEESIERGRRQREEKRLAEEKARQEEKLRKEREKIEKKEQKEREKQEAKERKEREKQKAKELEQRKIEEKKWREEREKAIKEGRPVPPEPWKDGERDGYGPGKRGEDYGPGKEVEKGEDYGPGKEGERGEFQPGKDGERGEIRPGKDEERGEIQPGKERERGEIQPGKEGERGRAGEGKDGQPGEGGAGKDGKPGEPGTGKRGQAGEDEWLEKGKMTKEEERIEKEKRKEEEKEKVKAEVGERTEKARQEEQQRREAFGATKKEKEEQLEKDKREKEENIPWAQREKEEQQKRQEKEEAEKRERIQREKEEREEKQRLEKERKRIEREEIQEKKRIEKEAREQFLMEKYGGKDYFSIVTNEALSQLEKIKKNKEKYHYPQKISLFEPPQALPVYCPARVAGPYLSLVNSAMGSIQALMGKDKTIHLSVSSLASSRSGGPSHLAHEESGEEEDDEEGDEIDYVMGAEDDREEEQLEEVAIDEAIEEVIEEAVEEIVDEVEEKTQEKEAEEEQPEEQPEEKDQEEDKADEATEVSKEEVELSIEDEKEDKELSEHTDVNDLVRGRSEEDEVKSSAVDPEVLEKESDQESYYVVSESVESSERAVSFGDLVIPWVDDEEEKAPVLERRERSEGESSVDGDSWYEDGEKIAGESSVDGDDIPVIRAKPKPPPKESEDEGSGNERPETTDADSTKMPPRKDFRKELRKARETEKQEEAQQPTDDVSSEDSVTPSDYWSDEDRIRVTGTSSVDGDMFYLYRKKSRKARARKARHEEVEEGAPDEEAKADSSTSTSSSQRSYMYKSLETIVTPEASEQGEEEDRTAASKDTKEEETGPLDESDAQITDIDPELLAFLKSLKEMRYVHAPRGSDIDFLAAPKTLDGFKKRCEKITCFDFDRPMKSTIRNRKLFTKKVTIDNILKFDFGHVPTERRPKHCDLFLKKCPNINEIDQFTAEMMESNRFFKELKKQQSTPHVSIDEILNMSCFSDAQDQGPIGLDEALTRAIHCKEVRASRYDVLGAKVMKGKTSKDKGRRSKEDSLSEKSRSTLSPQDGDEKIEEKASEKEVQQSSSSSDSAHTGSHVEGGPSTRQSSFGSFRRPTKQQTTNVTWGHGQVKEADPEVLSENSKSIAPIWKPGERKDHPRGSHYHGGSVLLSPIIRAKGKGANKQLMRSKSRSTSVAGRGGSHLHTKKSTTSQSYELRPGLYKETLKSDSSSESDQKRSYEATPEPVVADVEEPTEKPVMADGEEPAEKPAAADGEEPAEKPAVAQALVVQTERKKTGVWGKFLRIGKDSLPKQASVGKLEEADPDTDLDFVRPKKYFTKKMTIDNILSWDMEGYEAEKQKEQTRLAKFPKQPYIDPLENASAWDCRDLFDLRMECSKCRRLPFPLCTLPPVGYSGGVIPERSSDSGSDGESTASSRTNLRCRKKEAKRKSKTKTKATKSQKARDDPPSKKAHKNVKPSKRARAKAGASDSKMTKHKKRPPKQGTVAPRSSKDYGGPCRWMEGTVPCKEAVLPSKRHIPVRKTPRPKSIQHWSKHRPRILNNHPHKFRFFRSHARVNHRDHAHSHSLQKKKKKPGCSDDETPLHRILSSIHSQIEMLRDH